MKRNEMREQAFFLTFENLFEINDSLDELIELYSENVDPVCEYAIEVSAGIKDKLNEINEIINTYSKSWRISRLPKVTLAILYVALYEMKYVESVPENVAINEAVELAKKYASTDDASYINGILGAVSRSQ
ncbi:MAG: transcription antitermination factor NusB [Eubacterium sp.]|nr:transcription antitermination factor NusB [Eubacterium sp.]MDE6154965.1 transcription antitermination factor NusB [Eubacterium sp.]